MCNSEWSVVECLLAIHVVNFVLIAIGALLALVGLLTRDISAILTDQRPFFKIKDFEFNPLMPRRQRRWILGSGLALLAASTLWVLVTEIKTPLITRFAQASGSSAAGSPAGISLIGATFLSGDWNPRLLDLRTAASLGLHLSQGVSFKFTDLLVTVPDGTPASYQAQVQTFANDSGRAIGETGTVGLVPGLVTLGDVIPVSFQHPSVVNAWLPQEDWQELTLVLTVFEKDSGRVVQRTRTHVLLADQTRAWFLPSPYASLISIVYQINEGDKTIMDLRSAPVSGIQVHSGDRLRLWEIWFHTTSTDDSALVHAEAYLSSGSYDSSTYLETDASAFREGVQNLLGAAPFDWTVTSEKNLLILTLSRDMGKTRSLVLDRYEIPLSPAAPEGLVPFPTARTWPEGGPTYLDFKNGADLKDWTAADPVKFGLSDEGLSGPSFQTASLLSKLPICISNLDMVENLR